MDSGGFGLDLLVIRIDGIHMDRDLILPAAVGVDGNGDKHPLGVMEGASENAAVVYCQESPEPFFEDFGRAPLEQGAARVDIDPEFASLITIEDYMVFLSPEGDGEGLYVHARDALGFEVRERKGGRGSFDFSYRLVARRKDLVGARLKRLEPIDDPVEDLIIAMSEPPRTRSASGHVEV